jgi:hypothetical protein
MCFGTIFFCIHILQHHFSSHHFTSWIRRLLPTFFGRIWTKLRPWTFIWFFQVSILTHAKSIYKWFLWDGFRTPLRFFSPRRFGEWIPTFVSTLFSYRTRSHSMLNFTYLWGGLLFSHDQTFGSNTSHYRRGNVVSIHKLLSRTWKNHENKG